MSTNWQIGDKIEDRWEIHKILHRGMGIVYIVYDQEWHEAFAAKTYQEEIFTRNPLIVARFKQETSAWVNLDVHQNVTKAEFVQTIQGKPYLFLEYVSGGDLSGWIGTPRLTEDLPQVLQFAIQFCDGMIHALSMSIRAHRDDKPQNCLITEDRTLKVTDFGLAKVFDDATYPESVSPSKVKRFSLQLTQTGTGAGTMPYMAPEQFEDAKHVNVKFDIYSFGVMLYLMVTGRLPLNAFTWQKYERLHMTQSPNTDHIEPESLSEIIETCLRKDFGQRFADFDVLRKRLGDVYENLTGRPAPRPAEGADLSAVDLSNKGYALDELGRYEEALPCFDRAIQIKPQYAEAWSNTGISFVNLERYEEALSCFDQVLELNPRLEIGWWGKGAALDNLGCNDEALSCFDKTLELNPRFEMGWYSKGVTLLNLRRFEDAIACYEHALELNPRFEQAWGNKGYTLIDLDRPDEALSCFDQVLEINPQNQQFCYAKGNVLGNLDRFEEELLCYDRVLELNPQDEKAWSNKGRALADLRRYNEALYCCDRALELNPEDEKVWSYKGVSLMDLSRFEKALSCFEEAQRLGFLQAADAIALCMEHLGK